VPVHNIDVAETFNKLADLLEIDGANEFRVRAYRNAARRVSNLSRSVADLVGQGEDLTSLPGIGKDLAGKIAEIVNTGSLSSLEELRRKIPAGLLDLSELAGLGPKRVKALHQDLGISSTGELEKAARNGEVRHLPGFGAKTEQTILEELERRAGKQEGQKRIRLAVVEELAEALLSYLKKGKGVKRVEVAGSYRRRKETVGDLDILAVCKKDSGVMDHFVNYEDVERVVSKGDTRSTVLLRRGVQVDLRVVPEVSYGSALHYFTGSQAHNIAVRKIGVKKGLKINEYGVYEGKKRVAGRSEAEVYAQVDLPYIEPELRENQGEIEAAKENGLPSLVTLDDIRGDLHTHTKATDGNASLREMALAAQKKGYQYLAITDHSKHVTVAKGLNAERLAQQIEQIDQLNDELDGIVLLKGIELDILEDGSLDLPDDILKRLDLVCYAVHYKFNLSREEQTDRIIRAMERPYFGILAHPTGRLIDEREAYDVDMERLVKAAKQTGCMLELNAQPERLDLTDVHCRMARESGVMVAISTDAHAREELDFMRYGVYQARRGWLEAKDVLNTRTWKQLQRLLRKE